MNRYESTRRQRCARCGRVTMHAVSTYYHDSLRSEEIVYCTECGE